MKLELIQRLQLRGCFSPLVHKKCFFFGEKRTIQAFSSISKGTFVQCKDSAVEENCSDFLSSSFFDHLVRLFSQAEMGKKKKKNGLIFLNTENLDSLKEV